MCLSKVTYLSAECCFGELDLQKSNEASWTSDDRTLSHRNVTCSRHDINVTCSRHDINVTCSRHDINVTCSRHDINVTCSRHDINVTCSRHDINVTCSRHDIDEHIVHFSTTITHSPSYVVSSN